MLIEIWNHETESYDPVTPCCFDCGEAELTLYFDDEENLVYIEDEDTGDIWDEDDIDFAIEDGEIVISWE